MPVIIATGFAGMIAEEDYDKGRIDEVISKPYAVADVLARANVILAREASEHRETVLALSWLTLRIKLKLDTPRIAVNYEEQKSGDSSQWSELG